jgi:hypothetical protein
MSDADGAFNWQAIRQTGFMFVFLALAYALFASFGHAAYLGFTQPDLPSEEIATLSAGFVAGPVYRWSARGLIALLALAHGFALARRLEGERALLHALVMGVLALAVIALVRLGIGRIFPTAAAAARIGGDALTYVVSLGLALLGSQLYRREADEAPGDAGDEEETEAEVETEAEAEEQEDEAPGEDEEGDS